MKQITDYSKVFETIVEKTAKYLTNNNIKAQILGISGGIDSTVCSAICHEVSKRTGIPLIGRSLPTNYNKEQETSTADLVGQAFCDNYGVVDIHSNFLRLVNTITTAEDRIMDCYHEQSALANGNIQARLRMIYLYNLASIHKGLVIDTDNLTENNLGYFTIHGDVGDFNPIGGLWKTDIFKLAEWLVEFYDFRSGLHSNPQLIKLEKAKANSVKESLKLKPTAGLGITNSDLEEIGADSYEQVDYILQEILAWKKFKLSKGFYVFSHEMTCDDFLKDQQMLDIPFEVIKAVAERHFRSEFKRKELPVVIKRYELFV